MIEKVSGCVLSSFSSFSGETTLVMSTKVTFQGKNSALIYKVIRGPLIISASFDNIYNGETSAGVF